MSQLQFFCSLVEFSINISTQNFDHLSLHVMMFQLTHSPQGSLCPTVIQRLVCFGLIPGVGGRKPSLAIYEFDDKWNLMQYQMHHIEGLNYAHDFLLLPDYYVFHMTPFADMSFISGLKVFAGWSSPGELMKYSSHLPSRFVVIPRHKGAAHQDIKLLDTEPFHVRPILTDCSTCCV